MVAATRSRLAIRMFRVICLLFAITGTSTLASAEPAADVKANAREHFDRGVAAFEERRFAEAAKEFDAAYPLSPNCFGSVQHRTCERCPWKCRGIRGAFQTCLDQGGTTIPDEHRHAVLAELEKPRALIGTIAVHARPEGSDVHVDGKPVGTAPLALPVRVTAGKHSIVVMMDGYQAQARELHVGAGAQSELDLELRSTKLTPAPSQSTPNSVVVLSAPGTQTSTPASTVVNVQIPRQTAPALSTHQRTAGYVLGGLGLAVAGVGTYFVVAALADARDAKNRGDTDGFNAAKTSNYWGWGTIAAGAVAATTGLVLALTAPSGSSSQGLTLTPFSDGYAHGFSTTTTW